MINNIKNTLSTCLTTRERVLNEKRDIITSLFQSIATIPQNSTIKFQHCKTRAFYKVKGRHAQTLYWLLRHRNDGITPISVCNTAWRLANYVFYLRGACELDIKTEKEPHDGGTHARYFLISDIIIMDIIINGKSLFSAIEGA